MNAPLRHSIDIEGFSHKNPIPAASLIGPFLFTGALTGRDPNSGEMPKSLDEQCRNVFRHTTAVLDAARATPDSIVKMTFHLADPRDREALNREWLSMFPDSDSRPARQVIAARLDSNALIHCDLIAVLTVPADDRDSRSAEAEAAPAFAPDIATSEVSEETVAVAHADALTPELRAKLEAVPVAAMSQQLRKRGLNNVTIDGVKPTRAGSKLVGVATTLRFVPFREDLFDRHGGGFNAQKQAFDSITPGQVMVIEARGVPDAGTLGDILALRAHALGGAGIVTDGAIRDHDAIAAIDLPVFAKAAHPAVLGRRHIPWERDVTIGCGGTTVQPGDIIIGDADGVLVIPPAIVEEIVDAALAQEHEDGWIAGQVMQGRPLRGLFPLDADWRARYETESSR